MLYAFLSVACSGIDMPVLPQSSDAPNLLIIVHGSGDSASDWPLELKNAIEAVDTHTADWDVWTHDWETAADSRLSAAGSGMELGALIALELLEEPYAYEHLHLVGHSVGSFVIHSIAKTLTEEAGGFGLHSTFLDPFAGKGLLDWGYGEREFGRYADFAEAFYNIDDPVPSTNGALRFAHNFDVTALQPSDYNEDKTHWWPTNYYIESVNVSYMPGFSHSQESLDDGSDVMRARFRPGQKTVLVD